MRRTPPEGAIKEALKTPNGWIYEIDPEYDNQEAVPPHAIKGAWKVGANGIIEGDFIDNPNYKIK